MMQAAGGLRPSWGHLPPDRWSHRGWAQALTRQPAQRTRHARRLFLAGMDHPLVTVAGSTRMGHGGPLPVRHWHDGRAKGPVPTADEGGARVASLDPCALDRL